jgi:hypothetical protein
MASVRRERASWCEDHQRSREGFTAAQAMERAEESDLKILICSLALSARNTAL